MSATVDNRQAVGDCIRDSHSRSTPGRIGRVDWEQLSKDLDAHGGALIEGLLTRHGCDALAGLYSQDDIFRSRRHGVSRVRSGKRCTAGVIFHDAT